MTEKQVFERFVATESGIGLTRIRRAIRFMNDEEEKYNNACKHLMEKDRIIIPTGSKTVSEIRAITQKEEFDIIVVDYLQLVKPSGKYRGNRFAEVGEISHGLKAIGVDFKIPVVVLTQLNRQSEGKATKEPSMAEIRESGDIEQDASVILLLWNTDDEDRSKKGYKFDKNRQGTLKKGNLTFDGDRMKFYGEEDFVPASMSDLEIPFN
jgi:replicative DNA helicase